MRVLLPILLMTACATTPENEATEDAHETVSRCGNPPREHSLVAWYDEDGNVVMTRADFEAMTTWRDAALAWTYCTLDVAQR